MQRLLSATTAVIVAALLGLANESGARNIGQYQSSPEIEAWVQSLTDKNGMGCCATADGFPAEAVWDIEREHYRVSIQGRWYIVPDVAVITQPNRIGRAVVWYLDMGGGEISIRCFLPGAGT